MSLQTPTRRAMLGACMAAIFSTGSPAWAFDMLGKRLKDMHLDEAR